MIEGEIEVTTKEGAPLAISRPASATPGIAPAIRSRPTPVRWTTLLAWRQGALVFSDAPLTEVIAEFARYHAVNIELDARLGSYRLSGRLPSADLDGLLAPDPVCLRRRCAAPGA